MSKRELNHIIRAAIDLGYERVCPDVADRIKQAKTEVDITNIMIDCRKAMTLREIRLGL